MVKKFPLPALRMPESFHTVEDLRDALEATNRELVDFSQRLGALTEVSSNLANQLGGVLTAYAAGKLPEMLVRLDHLKRLHGVSASDEDGVTRQGMH